ncbi:MAG: FAD-dependent monooxygenase [Flavobacteriaceae bacterium]|nr:FAD-dependent monooxygenase [Flavobacteriaceae bacterium]
MKYTIIGAGIGGLTTALAFEKKGIEYEIFEKAPKLTDVGAGIWLAPNALQVFEYLYVLNDIKSAGNSINQITIGKADLSPLSDTHQDSIQKKFGYSTIAIHRAELQKVLARKIPHEKLHFDKGFKSFEEIINSKIKITFEDNATIETDYLIGADGINSKVRNQLFPNSTIRYSGQTCWRGVADIDLPTTYEHKAFELWGNQIRFGISKIAQNKVYWFAVALAEQNQKDDATTIQDKLVDMYTEFHPLVTEIITATPINKILRNDINDLKPLKKWHKNNCCLIGDAGHATTPNMGQGGGQAIEDAYYLSNLIEKNPNENIFELFQQKRQAKVNTIVKQSWTTGQLAHWKYGTGFRNFLLKNMPKKLLEKKMLEMYHIEQY